MRIFEKLSNLFGKSELKEIKDELKEIEKNRGIFMKGMYDLGKTLVNSVDSQTMALQNFLKLNEQFIQNMTKYFNFELSQMEKMAGKEPPEKTEYDGQF